MPFIIYDEKHDDYIETAVKMEQGHKYTTTVSVNDAKLFENETEAKHIAEAMNMNVMELIYKKME